MIQGIIFDFDGLILETEEPAFECVRQVFRDHGAELPAERWARVIGGTGGADGSGGAFDVYDYLEEQLGRKVDRDALRAVVLQRRLRLVEQLHIEPGVEEYIAQAKELGLKLAVASSSPRQWVVGHLEQRGLLAHFEVVVTRDDVARTKPEPDLYRAALKGLDLAPHQGLALEDSPNGITAAQRAGLFCVVVPNAMTADLPLDHADLRLASLADLPLRDLLDHVATIVRPNKQT
jgi:HAD superfamily hydrolase (TIGR01509 family)